MNLKSIKKWATLGLLVAAGHAGATVTPTLPVNDTTAWNNISNIAWSTNSGASWNDITLNTGGPGFESVVNTNLKVGDTLTFKFTLFKSELGTHYADFIKTWFDSNRDGQFTASEAQLFGYHVVNATQGTGNNNVVNQSFTFTSSLKITSAMIGDNWLLARVTCSESLLQGIGDTTWGDQWSSLYTGSNNAQYNSIFSSSVKYGQGDSELIKFRVVPEPGSVALLAIGMLGIGFSRRRIAKG